MSPMKLGKGYCLGVYRAVDKRKYSKTNEG